MSNSGSAMNPGPPGIPLEIYAAVSAHLAEAEPLPQILAAHGLTEQRWQEASVYWTQRLALDDDGVLERAYTAAFVAAQDEVKPIPSMTPEEWAILSAEVARGDPLGALALRSLSVGDYLRLARRWASVLGHDRDQARCFAEQLERLW
jgi:hypothetical protein